MTKNESEKLLNYRIKPLPTMASFYNGVISKFDKIYADLGHHPGRPFYFYCNTAKENTKFYLASKFTVVEVAFDGNKKILEGQVSVFKSNATLVTQ